MLDRLIDIDVPINYLGNAIESSYKKLAVGTIEDYNRGVLPDFNFPVPTRNCLSIVSIDGKLYLDGTGMEYLAQLKTVKDLKSYDIVNAQVNTYPTSAIMKRKCELYYGVDGDEYEDTFNKIVIEESNSFSVTTSTSLLEDFAGSSVSTIGVEIKDYLSSFASGVGIKEPRIPLLVGHCLTGDTKIRLLDGTCMSLEDLSLMDPTKEFWVYACKTDGEIVPAPAFFSRVTKQVGQLAYVHLDNGEIVKCTVDHPFLTREGIYIEAKDLQSGESLMPLYYVDDTYPRIVDNVTGKYVSVHRYVSDCIYGYREGYDRHHRDKNPKNNNPDNLLVIKHGEHSSLHLKEPGKIEVMREGRSQNGKNITNKIWYTEEYKETRNLIKKLASETMSKLNTKNWSDPEYRKLMSSSAIEQWGKEGSLIREKLKETASARVSARNKTLWKDSSYRISVVENVRKGKILRNAKKVLESGLTLNEENYNNSIPIYSKAINIFGDSLESSAACYNHKVLFVEIVNSPNTDVYDITVPDYHNFALESGVFVHNTGIGKTSVINAIVKTIPSVWGFRLVNIKAGFLDKSDLLGFVSSGTIDVLDGYDTDGNPIYKKATVAQDSPMMPLMSSTDAFVEAARKAITKNGTGKIEDIIDIATLDDEEKQAFELLRTHAKIPVLVFDELNRTIKSIYNQLMTLFSEKILGGGSVSAYTWRNAPMIGAINFPIDVRNTELEEMYTVIMTSDPAKINRFKVIKMSHLDPTVLSTTKDWMVEEFSADLPKISEFIDSLIANRLFYNPEKFETDNKAEYYGKFPTFRGWEQVFTYLISKKKAGTDALIDPVINSIIGKAMDENGFKKFFPDIRFVATVPGGDMQQILIDECYDAGLPSLLLGRFGIAKTAKVDDLKSRGAIVHTIHLSSQDRTTVRGNPKRRKLADLVIKGLGHTEIGSNFIAITKKTPGVPKFTTDSVPYEFIKTINECVANNTPLVLFYDELNRCLSGDTKIRLLDGTNPTLKELLDIYGLDKEYWVYSCSPTGEIIPAKAKNLGITRKNATLLEVELDNGEIVKCTPDHKFMSRSGEYVEAQYLNIGDSIMPLYYSLSEQSDYIISSTFNHKIVSVKVLDNIEDAYDITVPGYENFALTAGIFVHNCTPVVQSAVFDAISDKLALGCDLSELSKRGLLKVFAAGNVGDDYSGDTSPLDAATLARFACYNKQVINSKDIDNFVTGKWANEHLSDDVLKMMKGSKDAMLDEFNKETGDINILSDLFSFRNIASFDNFLRKNREFYLCNNPSALWSKLEDLLKYIELPAWGVLKYQLDLKTPFPGSKELGFCKTADDFLGYIKTNGVTKLTPNDKERVFDTILAIDSYCYKNFWSKRVETDLPKDYWNKVENTLSYNLYSSLAESGTRTYDDMATVLLAACNGVIAVNNNFVDTLWGFIEEKIDPTVGKITMADMTAIVHEVLSRLDAFIPGFASKERAICNSLLASHGDNVTLVSGAIFDHEVEILLSGNGTSTTGEITLLGEADRYVKAKSVTGPFVYQEDKLVKDEQYLISLLTDKSTIILGRRHNDASTIAFQTATTSSATTSSGPAWDCTEIVIPDCYVLEKADVLDSDYVKTSLGIGSSWYIPPAIKYFYKNDKDQAYPKKLALECLVKTVFARGVARGGIAKGVGKIDAGVSVISFDYSRELLGKTDIELIKLMTNPTTVDKISTTKYPDAAAKDADLSKVGVEGVLSTMIMDDYYIKIVQKYYATVKTLLNKAFKEV